MGERPRHYARPGEAVAAVTPAATPADLTPREREVLALVALGLTNAEIGQVLGISRKTVANHCWAVFQRLPAGVGDNRLKVTLWYLQHGGGQ